MSESLLDGTESVPLRLLAIRHAPTLAEGLCVGDAEVPCVLSAEASAERMLDVAGDSEFACMWSSPMMRCLAPARLLAERLALPLRIDERLREISLGAWQGRSWVQVEASDPARYKFWLANWIDVAAPGGESTMQLLQRVRAWWKELSEGDHLLVAHAGIIRALRVLVRGESWMDAMHSPVPHLQGHWFDPEKSER
jgi:alpha-ribazole phosphatase